MVKNRKFEKRIVQLPAEVFLKIAQVEDILSNKQLVIWQYLQSVDEAANQQIAEATKIAYATVRQTLSKLLKLKKIARIGMGRSSRYRKI